MRIGTRLTTVAVSASLVSLVLYGIWSVGIRRDQLHRELSYEEANLATILRSALEMALEQRDISEARDVVEQLSTAERIHGIAVRSAEGAEVTSDSVRRLAGRVPRKLLDEALDSGREQQLRLDVDGRPFLVHVLPLHARNGGPLGMAEVWRDLTYIDEYLRATALRLLLLAIVIGALLTTTIVVLTNRSVTRPADALVRAMHEVSEGNLAIRVTGARAPEGELGDIARSFDALAQRLQAAKEDLEKSATERAALTARLRQSERLATLGQVVAEVAHEIGTPLNVITGRAEHLAHQVDGNGPALDCARMIAEQGRRITRIMQRLLHLARERMPVLEPVAILPVARRTADFLAPEFARARVALHLDGDEAAKARADQDLVQQVLLNLLLNALQASPAGAAVRAHVVEREGQVFVDVRDEGPGVAPEILPRLFEPFATTKAAGKGTGLGLSLSRSILRQMGGTLRLVEEPGAKGAHFQAALLSAAPARHDEASFAARTAPTGLPSGPGSA